MEEISYANPQSTKKSRISKRLFVFGGLFIVILILLGSAIYFITRDTSPQEDEVTKSIILPDEDETTPTPTESTDEEGLDEDEGDTTPTPTEEAEVEVTISVQNGSGVQGAAGEAAGVLRNAGFTVSSTTNADNTNYTDVSIQIKNSMRNQLDAIEEALSEEYTIGSTTTDLSESSSVDAIVIIGS